MMSFQLAKLGLAVPCSCRGDGERSVADSGQSCIGRTSNAEDSVSLTYRTLFTMKW